MYTYRKIFNLHIYNPNLYSYRDDDNTELSNFLLKDMDFVNQKLKHRYPALASITWIYNNGSLNIKHNGFILIKTTKPLNNLDKLNLNNDLSYQLQSENMRSKDKTVLSVLKEKFNPNIEFKGLLEPVPNELEFLPYNYSTDFKLTVPAKYNTQIFPKNMPKEPTRLSPQNMLILLSSETAWQFNRDYEKDTGIKSFIWYLDADNQHGRIEVNAIKHLSNDVLNKLSKFISGQNSDGLGESFEQFYSNYPLDYDDNNDEASMASFDWLNNKYKLKKEF